MRTRRLLCVLFAVCLAGIAVAQENDPVAAQKRKIAALEQKIAKEEQAISKLKADRSTVEERVRRLALQVENRNRLIAETEKQAQLLRNEIGKNKRTADQLDASLETNRAAYADMVREAYRNYKQNNYLTYIFAARDFRDISRRISDLRAVATMRADKMHQIDSLSGRVADAQRQLNIRKRSLDSVTRNLTGQRKKLQSDVDDARGSVQQLSQQEKSALQRKVAQQEQLDVEIDALRKLTKGNTQGESFSSKTSGLRLPVAGGHVIRYKGNVAEIGGARGANVTAIYEGKVVEVKQNRITGKYEVYVAHGEYISSYANLESVRVQNGASVTRNAVLGAVGSSVDILSMQTTYKIIFGIYAPSPTETLQAASFFK